jgi:hypothetical protein
LYRFDAEPARVRVYDGKVDVTQGKDGMSLTKGKEVVLGAVMLPGKFDVKGWDELYVWSQLRAAAIAQANISAARSMRTNGFRSTSSIWAWSPTWGTLTYLPRSGYYHSIFGFYFYSPGAVWQTYPNAGYRGGNSGGGGGAASQSGWSGMGSVSNSGYSSSSVSSVSSSTGRAAVSTSAPAMSSSAGGRGR